MTFEHFLTYYTVLGICHLFENYSFEISNEKKDVTMILENKKVLDSTLTTIKLIHNLNKAKQSLEKKIYFIHNKEENESFQKIPSLKNRK